MTSKHKQNDEDRSGFPPGLAAPAKRALASAGYTRLEELNHASEDELKQLHGMGPKALEQVRTVLRAVGLRFKEKA